MLASKGKHVATKRRQFSSEMASKAIVSSWYENPFPHLPHAIALPAASISEMASNSITVSSWCDRYPTPQPDAPAADARKDSSPGPRQMPSMLTTGRTMRRLAPSGTRGTRLPGLRESARRNIMSRLPWRGVRVAEGAAFEMRSAGNRSGGSNPSLSVNSFSITVNPRNSLERLRRIPIDRNPPFPRQ